VFDEPNLVSGAGLVPVLELAESAGLTDMLDRLVSVPVPNVAVKARTVIAGMLAGADSIDDVDVLRSGGTARVMGGVRAPSTVGTFLRAHKHGHVLQLAGVNRRLLTGLADRVPGLVGADGVVFLDLDDTIREVHGHQKEGAGYGYTKVRGLNALFATISTTSTAPVVAEFSLRRGSTRSGKSADWFTARALATIGQISPGRQVLVRGDSAFCTSKHVHAVLRGGAWFSFTIQQWPTVTAAIRQIPEDAWTPIVYPRAVRDEETGELISEAEVAEIAFTAFTSKRKAAHVECRLVVRRVKRSQPAPAGKTAASETWRYHAFITNSTLSTVDADVQHRQHAIIEQTIAELKGGPLAHLPSGRFHANAAWVGYACITFNIARAAAVAAGTATARMATVQRTLINVPARIASTARQLVLHLPARWPWQHAWTQLWNTATATATGPPTPSTT
jgi:hypothetical protein